MPPQQELGHKLAVCSLLMSWGCCVTLPCLHPQLPCAVAVQAPVVGCCAPAPGSSRTILLFIWLRQLCAAPATCQRERAVLPLPKLQGLAG